MFRRQTTGSVVCVSCGYLVGVNDERCYNCGRRNPGLWGYAGAIKKLGNDLGFTPFVIATCSIVFMLSLLMSRGAIGMDGLFSFLSPSGYALAQIGASGQIPVRLLGRWWSVLSAVWIHGSLAHIFLNMWFITRLGPASGEFYGPGRTVIIYTVAGVASFIASTLGGNQLTVGASGAIFGLMGALIYYGRRTGSSHISQQAMYMAVSNFLLGFMLAGVDNWAHGGGLIAGYLMGMALDPMQPERPRHMMIALVCLGLSILSILASVLVPIGLG